VTFWHCLSLCGCGAAASAPTSTSTRMLGAVALAALAALGNPPAPALLPFPMPAQPLHGLRVPTLVGRWTDATPSLPSALLPAVPLSGNGYTGIMLHGDLGLIDLNINANTMWRTFPAAPNADGSVPVPTAHRVALGGLRIEAVDPMSMHQEIMAFSAEQQIGAGVLLTNHTSADGAVLASTTALHPTQQVVATTLRWSDYATAEIHLNVSTWVAGRSSYCQGWNCWGSPCPAASSDDEPGSSAGKPRNSATRSHVGKGGECFGSSASCCDAAGRPTVCSAGGGGEAFQCVTRNASIGAATPKQVWAGLVTRLALGTGCQIGHSTAAADSWRNTSTADPEGPAPNGLPISTVSTLVTVQPGAAFTI
jgi:hypothetical protein